jgi:hypothetical protein
LRHHLLYSEVNSYCTDILEDDTYKFWEKENYLRVLGLWTNVISAGSESMWRCRIGNEWHWVGFHRFLPESKIYSGQIKQPKL